MKNRDDDLDEIVKACQENPRITVDALHIVVMLSLICKTIRDGNDALAEQKGK